LVVPPDEKVKKKKEFKHFEMLCNLFKHIVQDSKMCISSVLKRFFKNTFFEALSMTHITKPVGQTLQ